MIQQIKEIYYNDKQIEFLEAEAIVKTAVWGRGTGKTRIIPEDIYDRAVEMPRSRQFLAAFTYDQIYDNILPDLHEVFAEHGLIEDVHYVIDKKPPKHFAKPYKRLENPSRSLSLIDGTAFQFISLGRYPNLIRGRSFDGGILDEGLLIPQTTMSKIVLPTLRGINHWDSKMFKMLSIYTSRPTDPAAMWIMNYKKLAKQLPKKYFFSEANAYDNIYILGEDYIPMMEQQMNYVDFQIEILNKDVTDMPDNFYHAYHYEKHSYSYEFELDKRSRSDRLAISDYRTSEEIDLSFDFGGAYSCATASQSRNFTEHFIKEFDTNNLSEAEKEAGKVKKLDDIVLDFINHYADHNNKRVNIYGDRTGTHEQVRDKATLYDSIKELLEDAGWIVILHVSSDNNPRHKSKWFLINECFKQETKAYPSIKINANECPNLLIAIRGTKIKDDFKKDKKDERNKKFNQSHAPHLTDTLDYKIMRKYAYLLEDGGGSSLEDSTLIL